MIANLEARAAVSRALFDRNISGLLRPPDHPKDVEGRKFRLSMKVTLSRRGVVMLERLLRKVSRYRNRDYYQTLQRYRRAHPESLEEERKQIERWLAFVEARRHARNDSTSRREIEVDEGLRQLREAARVAFMSHPAATEIDFQRCWPKIRYELLTQHALDALAADPSLLALVSQQVTDAHLRSEPSDQMSINVKLVR
jgi:hypothetical protein